MSNDNKKTKNIASCEEKQDMRELTPDELAKVNGGCAGLTTVTIPGGKISREAADSIDGAQRQR